MKIKSMKKVLSSVFIAIYLIVYTAPIGFCITSSSAKLDAGITKPVLRGATAKTPTSLKLEGDILISKGNPKVNLSLRSSDVQQVLRMFADKAGLNIIFHDSVSGRVTLDLVNVPLNDAFRMVMQVTNLTYYIDHNTMVVTSAAAAQTLNLAKQEMVAIPVKYMDASVLAGFLNKNIFSMNKPGLSNSQIAITNPVTNEILIFGTKNDALMAQKIVAQFDIEPKEETFVVNHTTPKEMADLLCDALGGVKGAKTYAEGANDSAASSSSSSSAPAATPASPATPPAPPAPPPAPPAPPAPGNPTGGATPLSLGEGTIACHVDNSVNAGNLSSLNTKSLTITYFSQRGSINVYGGSEQQMKKIRDFITRNDKKQPQAIMEISVIELSESGSKEFSNTWNMWSTNFTGTFDGSTHSNKYFPQFIKGDGYTLTDGNFPPKTLYTFAPYTDPMMITYAMNYLIKNGKGRMLANPRIMVTNGEASIINLTSDYVSSVTATTNTSAAGNVTTYTYNIAKDNGIQINLTPFISPDGYVTLNIKPSYSAIKEKVPGPPDTTVAGITVATLLDRRDLDLKNIRIKDGETLVIGGMITENEQKNVSKIPVLGDLPGVGMFFRNTSSTKAKEELVIMLTPKIIKESEDLTNTAGATL